MTTVGNTITSDKRGPIASAAFALAAIALYVAMHVLLQPVAFPANILPFYLGAGLAFAMLLVAGERWCPVLFVARLIPLLLPSGPHLPMWLAITDALSIRRCTRSARRWCRGAWWLRGLCGG